ncbi:MAG: NPCBM/NEW2 domain-containing protein [Clostridia bacterium]|nr:NPCBM/NEW2 domain-containing protein [Clostridia bacterium]
MLKKIVSILLCVSLLWCLSACDSEKNETVDETLTTEIYSNDTQNNTALSYEDDDVIVDNEININNVNDIKSNGDGKISAQTNVSESQNSSININVNAQHLHDYSNATCTSPKKCSCGATAGSALGHNFSVATCTSPKICTRCGTTTGSSLGHSFSAANCVSPKTCKRCNQTSGSALGHNYINNKCSRCGAIDPDTLPKGLNEVFVIDSYEYKYHSSSFVDSFGNSYNGAHYYTDLYECRNGNEPHSLHNLNNNFKTFSGSIVASTTTYADSTYYINIYADNKLVFSKTNFTRTSGKVDFKVDVTNCQTLKIAVGLETGSGDYRQELCIVNAQLTK